MITFSLTPSVLTYFSKSMANYNPLVKPTASLNRNGFDLSQRHVFSAQVGQLLPVVVLDCIPGDHHEFDCASLIQTMPVKSDAFARMTAHFETYFVPYSQMWDSWNSLITQRQLLSSAHQHRSTYSPCFDLKNFLTSVNLSRRNGIQDIHGRPAADNALRLADMLGYGSYYSMFKEERASTAFRTYEDSHYMNIWRIGAYNKIWYDYYRNKFYDDSVLSVYTWNFDDLGSPVMDLNNTTPDDISLYRVEARVTPDASNPYTSLDSLVPANLTQRNTSVWTHPMALFQMRYRQWKKDIFTSLMPSAQYGVVSSVTMSNIQLINIGNLENSRNAASAIVNGSTGSNAAALRSQGTTLSDNDSRWNIPNAVDVYQIKRAQMLQKWRESVLRGGDSLSGQTKARFGVTPKHSSDDTCEYVGAWSTPIEINPVYSQAATSEAPLGEIAGRGRGTGAGHFEYNATEYGVLMCIMSILPESEYDSIMIDKQNTFIEPFDYFTPEFENVGLEPVHGYQLNALGSAFYPTEASLLEPIPSSDLDAVLGYTSRYSCYKTAVDKVHGEFQARGMFMSPETDTEMPIRKAGSLVHWVMPRWEMQYNSGRLRLSSIYISPDIDRSLFEMSFPIDEYPDNAWDTYYDHYLFDAYFNVKSVRPLSVTGLPQW